MKIWPFDKIAVETAGLQISSEQLTWGLEPLRRIRYAVGRKLEIALELHGRWHVPAAIKIAQAAEEYEPMWLEDPMRLDNMEALDRLCRSTRTPVLVGETLGGRFAYRDVLERTGVRIIMSNPCWTGGVTEIRRVADPAALHQRAFTPHDRSGPIALATGSHVSLHAENAVLQRWCGRSCTAGIRT